MVLARNTYRFSLLLVGSAIAGGLDDIGAYDAEGIALLGLGLGGFALFAGTVAHYARGGPDGGARSDGTDEGTDGRGPDGAEGRGGHETAEDGEEATNAPTPWEWYRARRW